MHSLISQATGRDLAIVFITFAIGGFLYKMGDIYLLSKVENAMQLPSGVLA